VSLILVRLLDVFLKVSFCEESLLTNVTDKLLDLLVNLFHVRVQVAALGEPFRAVRTFVILDFKMNFLENKGMSNDLEQKLHLEIVEI
jgi:hypothetical protein